MEIHFNGFLDLAIKEYPKEACGFLFSKMPYSQEEEWFVFPVKNISANPENEWIPDKKEMLRVKQKATKMGLVKIGNIHTHPYPDGEWHIETERMIIRPSKKDLQFARRFNDVVRIILVTGKDYISDCFVHDKFGNQIRVLLNGVEP
jgi:hypothetical protein